MTFLSIFLLTIPDATARTIGFLTLASQLAGFIFEVPSGYISDRIGHKKALVISRVALLLSTTCFLFANQIWWFIVGSILLGIGVAFMSGTSSAFMHDTLTALGKDNEYAAIMGKLKSIGFAVPIAFILLLPVLAETSFRLAFGVALIIDIIGLIAAISLNKPPIQKHVVEEITTANFKSVLKEFNNVGWLPFVFFGAIIFGLSFGATAGFKNPYQEMLGFSISMLGVLWALSRVAISGLLLLNGWVHRTFSFKQFMVIKTTIYALSFVGIGMFSNMWVVALLFIIGNTIMWGLGSADTQYYLEFIKTSSSKATLLSIKSLLSKLISAGAGVLMGVMVVANTFPIAYVVFGSSLLIVAMIALLILPENKIAHV